MLAVVGLGKRYGRRWVFRDVTFELSKGDRMAVIGRNGSGKSTLLKMVAGLLRPSEGSVEGASDRCCLGYCGLEQSLYADLSVREHLLLAGKLRGCDHRANELLQKVGLMDAESKLAKDLSTGMKSRLRMALAIQANPTILLLDEPGASLDEHGRMLVEAIIQEQCQRGCLLFATNDSAERRFANFELELEG